MTIDQISQWLADRLGRPAPPKTVAQELNECTTAGPTPTQWKNLVQSIKARFCTAQRKQLTDLQVEAIELAAVLGRVGGSVRAHAFPNFNRAAIAFQLMARVIEPSLVNQGGYQLCGPAGIVVGLAKSHPLKYVQACMELADKGQAKIGDWLIEPSALIRNHTAKPEADWILLASIRADDRAFTETMYGTSGAGHLFDWLIQCGYKKVLIANNFPLKMHKSQPPGLLPPGLSASDKLSMAQSMASLSLRGWTVLLMAYGDMPTAISAVDGAGKHRFEMLKLGVPEEMIQTGVDATMESVKKSDNPSLVEMGWKLLTGNASAHTMHVTYINRMQILGQEVKINCVNFGQSQRWITLPLDGFVNKFAGFAAATDI